MENERPIVPRRVDLGFPAPVPRHWAGDPVFTRISDALSLLFPAGEQFFIQAVNRFKDRIADEGLRERVRGFAYQEAQHSTAHAAYNRMLEEQGLEIGWVERSLQRRLAFAKRFLPEVQQLALTATAEHLTATMAEGLLASLRDQLGDADPRMRALYYWHAVEEVEHKSVAWDVYERVARGGYVRRVVAQLWITLLVVLNVSLAAAWMLYRDGLLLDARTWRRSLPLLWGRAGFFTRMVRPYLRGFRPRFHPDDTPVPRGYREFVAAWRRQPDALAASEAALASAA
jgi:predicted metal-dependent hydrolase